MLNVYVIGCGGIGGYLIDRLPMVISSLSLDLAQQAGLDIQHYLDAAGTVAYPCIVDNLVFVDGDVFNPRNAMRQGMGAGSKLAQRMISVMKSIKQGLDSRDAVADSLRFLKKTSEDAKKLKSPLEIKEAVDILMDDRHLTEDYMQALQSEMVRVSCLQSMKLIGYNEYIRPSNFKEIMPEVRSGEVRQDTAGILDKLAGEPRKRLSSNTVVFLGVDNAKTRYEVCKYMESFRNCLVINGGNSKTEGQVNVYERQDGRALDPQLFELYPDISPDADRRPDEMACTVIAPSHDQIAVTNSLIADVMLSKFIRWVRYGLDEMKRNGVVRYNEVIVNSDKFSTMSLCHPLKPKGE